MNRFLLLGALFIVLPPFSASGQEVPAREPIHWQLRDGTRRTGRFVDLVGQTLVINQGGKLAEIRLDWLAPASAELAKSLVPQSDAKAIETIRAMEFVGIKAGKFDMGAPAHLTRVQDDEPLHPVRITRHYFLKETEVTWAEWKCVRELAANYGYHDLGEGRNGYQGDDSQAHPVTEVTWWDAVKWCNALSQIQGKTPVYHTEPSFGAASILKTGTPEIHVNWEADGFRLPTEAEWEHAWWQHAFSEDGKFPEPDGWSNEDSGGNTHPVSTRPSATSKRLDDMSGNVAEWCWDWKSPLDRAKLVTDPRGPAEGPHRVFRGGSWADHRMRCLRQSYRGDYSPVAPASYFVGFRPARNAGK